MAVTLDTASAYGQATTTTLTIPYTTGSSATLMTADVIRGTGAVVSGITYNSIAMTQLDSQTADPDFNQRVDSWYLASPASGTNNVVVTFDSAANAAAVIRTYNGATSPPTGTQHVKQTTAVTSFSGTAVTSTTNSMVADVQASDVVTLSNTASQITDGDLVDGINNARKNHSTHVTGASSVTMSYTYNASTALLWIGYSIDASGGTPGSLVNNQILKSLVNGGLVS